MIDVVQVVLVGLSGGGLVLGHRVDQGVARPGLGMFKCDLSVI